MRCSQRRSDYRRVTAGSGYFTPPVFAALIKRAGAPAVEGADADAEGARLLAPQSRWRWAQGISLDEG